MKILEKINAEDLFLVIEDFIVLSDIHIGYEESLNKNGFLLPISNTYEIKKKIKMVTSNKNINKIILNGDIVHSFGKISSTEKKAIYSFLKFLKDTFDELIIIKGNHDKILKYIVKEKIHDEYVIKNILITHGDIINKKSSDKNIKTIVIGHEHPSITISSGYRQEKYKCFLKGKYLNKNLVIMPSCNMLVEGTDILKDKTLSPYIKEIEQFKVYIVEDKIYDFGKISSIKKRLSL
ncbi:MAG: metallophosphoesterase [Candidatus Woesearchaeota archaeon]